MSITQRSLTSFIMVPCRCGRLLRAKYDQVGTEIRCWDCHLTTLVTVPKARRRVFWLCCRNALDLLNGPGSVRNVRAACLMTLALMVPYAGLGIAGIFLIGAAAAYADLIRSESRLSEPIKPDWKRIGRETRPDQWGLCLLFALGTCVPLWVLHSGYHVSPHFSRSSLALMVATWVLMPIAIAASCGESDAADGRRYRFRFVIDQPLCLLLVLMVPPVSLVLLEAAVDGILYLAGWLPGFAIDYMPVPGKPQIYNGMPFYGVLNYFDMPSSFFLGGYRAGIRQGYSLVAGIPPSLSVPTNAEVHPMIFRWTAGSYYLVRVLITWTITLGLTVGLGIQARCLNVLVNSRRYLAG